MSAKIVVIAAGPKDAYNLFDDNERPDVLFKAAKEAKPIRLACLDVALSSLPDKDTLYALGVDRPLYFSVHSAYAKLAPKDGVLIHVAKYLGTSIERFDWVRLRNMYGKGWIVEGNGRYAPAAPAPVMSEPRRKEHICNVFAIGQL